MANQEGSFVGRYGDTLRRLTALDSQGGKLAPQQVGGADTGGFGPTLQVEPVTPQQGAFGQEPAQAEPAPATPPAGAFAAPAPVSGFGSPLPDNASGVLAQTPGIAGPVQQPGQDAFGGGQGPVAMGGDKPTSFGDLTADADDDQKEELAAQVEKQAGPGGLKSAFKRITDVLGAKTPELKLERKEMALYVAEVALRAMSKRSDPRYADNPDGVFADAVLETQAERDAKSEKTRLESRADAETRRKETREDAKDEKVYTRGRTDKETDHTRDRKEKTEDDERNHKQALELARVQAKLLREKGQRTSIQVGDDGTLKLIDLESGEAVTVTEESEVTETKGSRGKGTTTTTKKVRKPVKAAPKYNAGGLDDDTRVNRISDAEKALRGDKKLMRELGSKYANDRVKIETALRDMAREKVEGDVQSLSGGGSGTIDFNDLK